MCELLEGDRRIGSYSLCFRRIIYGKRIALNLLLVERILYFWFEASFRVNAKIISRFVSTRECPNWPITAQR